jgi:hypothetical protein
LSLAPRIAIACSGLGHVQRGIEAWAFDMTQALQRAGADVTLFAGAHLDNADAEALPTLRRTGPATVALAKGLRHLGGWRFGMGSAYELEQTSFALALWRRIRHDFDILHVQDPVLALWLERVRRAGLSRARVIYANGTGETASVMRHFPYLQLASAQAGRSVGFHDSHFYRYRALPARRSGSLSSAVRVAGWRPHYLVLCRDSPLS